MYEAAESVWQFACSHLTFWELPEFAHKSPTSFAAIKISYTPKKLTLGTWKITLGKRHPTWKSNPIGWLVTTSNIRGSPPFNIFAISLPYISSGSPRKNSKSILDPPAAAHGGRMVARISREYRGPHQLEINLGSDLGKWKKSWEEYGKVRNLIVSSLWISDDKSYWLLFDSL